MRAERLVRVLQCLSLQDLAKMRVLPDTIGSQSSRRLGASLELESGLGVVDAAVGGGHGERRDSARRGELRRRPVLREQLSGMNPQEQPAQRLQCALPDVLGVVVTC